MEVDVDITDCAGGYATWTSIPEDCEVLAVEHEINLMAPVVGERLEALGTVLRWDGARREARDIGDRATRIHRRLGAAPGSDRLDLVLGAGKARGRSAS